MLPRWIFTFSFERSKASVHRATNIERRQKGKQFVSIITRSAGDGGIARNHRGVSETLGRPSENWDSRNFSREVGLPVSPESFAMKFVRNTFHDLLLVRIMTSHLFSQNCLSLSTRTKIDLVVVEVRAARAIIFASSGSRFISRAREKFREGNCHTVAKITFNFAVALRFRPVLAALQTRLLL